MGKIPPPTANDPVSVYFTTGSIEEADHIVTTLLEEQLIACGNLIPEIRSIYRWEGRICRDSESAVIAKTIHSRVDAVINRIVDLHPYDCPCVTVWPIDGGSPEYLRWMIQQTGEPKARGPHEKN